MRRTLPLHMSFVSLMTSLLMACGPGGEVDGQNNKFLIYDYDSEVGDYRLKRAHIKTLRHVRTVDGDVVFLRGGGDFTVKNENPVTEKDWRDALVVEDSKTPTVEYTVDADGTVVPWDFDSAMMLTVYHHMERSAEYFDSIPTATLPDMPVGKISEVVGRIPVYYYPNTSLFGIPVPVFTDNAAYAFTMNAFIVPPRLSITDAVPIYANRGVLTHEYAHAVFNRLVSDGKAVPDFVLNEDSWVRAEERTTIEAAFRALSWDEAQMTALLQNNARTCHINGHIDGGVDEQTSLESLSFCNFVSINELRGLDEGLADIFAFLNLKDPNFITPSITMDIGRDMRQARFYDHEMKTFISYEKEGDPHALGAVIASLFYTLRMQLEGVLDDDALGTLMFKTMRDIKNPPNTFRISQFINALYDNLPQGQRATSCALFQERLDAIAQELTCIQ